MLKIFVEIWIFSYLRTTKKNETCELIGYKPVLSLTSKYFNGSQEPSKNGFFLKLSNQLIFF